MRKITTFWAAIAVIGLVLSPAFAADPVIHWTFDGTFANSGTGGSAYDAVLVDGANGTNAFAAGVADQALDFGNSDLSNMVDGDYVKVDYTLPDAGTIAMWYHVEPYYNYQSIFDVIGEDTSVDPPVPYSANDWEMWIYNTGMIRGRVHSANNFYDAVDADLNASGGANNWVHIAYTWDKNDDVAGQQLYINGQVASSKAPNWVDPPQTFALAGGNDENSYGVGAFDDVRIYEQRLTGDEVRALPGVTPDAMPEPVIYYPMDGNLVNQGTGGPAYDGNLVVGPNGLSSFVTGSDGTGQALDLGHTSGTPGSDKTDGAYVAVSYVLPDEGAIVVDYKPEAFYNYNSVWNNSCNPDDWEMWIYGDSRLRGRVDGNQGDITFNISGSDYATVDDWLQITYTWKKPTDTEPGYAAMYVDGQLVNIDPIDTLANWKVPGDTFYLAGSSGNTFGIGTFDEVMIFDQYLTSAQAAKLAGITEAVPEPATCTLLGIALGCLGLLLGRRHAR